MTGSPDQRRAQTIVRRVSSADGSERFCVLRESLAPVSNAFMFTCVCTVEGLPIAQACDHLMAAGLSEPDSHRLLNEARVDYQLRNVAKAQHAFLPEHRLHRHRGSSR